MRGEDRGQNYNSALVPIASEHRPSPKGKAAGPSKAAASSFGRDLSRALRVNAGNRDAAVPDQMIEEIAPGPRAMIKMSNDNHRMCSGQPPGTTKNWMTIVIAEKAKRRKPRSEPKEQQNREDMLADRAEIGRNIRRQQTALCTPHEKDRKSPRGSKSRSPWSDPTAKKHRQRRAAQQAQSRCMECVRRDCGPVQGIRARSLRFSFPAFCPSRKPRAHTI